MNVTDIHNTINLTLPIAVPYYKGNKDICGTRNGFGTEEWHHDSPQKYQGIFYNDCPHKFGTYEWNYGRERYAYEGKIYANNLDGYGLLSYPNGGSYEGLFKYNQRYGPGVFTYPDTSQDVGLWNGTNLIRLSIKINPESVPILAKSVQAKAFLFQYKKIISVAPRSISIAGEILSQLNASEKLIKERNILYNKYIGNPNSTFFDIDNFDGQYFSDEEQFVDVVVEFKNGVPVLEQKAVSDVLAWNNEEKAISIMKHIFLHRNYECDLSFSVNNILSGERNDFRVAGLLETACIDFLNSCCKGNHKDISQLIIKYDLNPDISDLIGNSGIHFASSNNNTLAIKVLVNFGANLDILNDEGLTSLILCILKYIDLKENITDWEKAFLPLGTPEIKHPQWRPYISTVSDTEAISRQAYILDLKCKHPDTVVIKKSKSRFRVLQSKSPPKSPSNLKNKSPVRSPKNKKRGKDTKSKSRVKVEERVPTDEEIKAELEKTALEEKLKEICNTILLLLHYGADPNYGQVPLPSLILSIFTKEHNLIHQLIKHGADCNITTAYQDGSLTPLHIVTSLSISSELIAVAEILLQNGAQANPRSNTNHWVEEKRIIDPENFCNDEGKSPLHLLAMRYDFIYDTEDILGKLYDILVENGGDPNLYYLGHTCLTLAIIRGNLSLIDRILGSYKVDPNQFLGCGMGVPLTVLILKRYKYLLPLQTCKAVYEILNNYNANPFNIIFNFEGNAIEFCDEENREDVQIKGKKETKKKDPHIEVIQFLSENAQQILDRHIQGYVVKCIYDYRIECDFVDKIFNEMVKFINVQDTIRILQILINKDLINYHPDAFLALVKYVEKKSGKKNKPKKQKDKSSKSSPKISEMEDIVKNLVKEQLPILKIDVPLPEIDPDEEKYIVCYNCHKKVGKKLVACPKCELVYFCSEQCNRINVRRNTKHKCKGIFYNSELKKILALEKSGLKFESKMHQLKKFRDEYFADPEHDFDIKYAFSAIASKFSELLRTKSTKRKKDTKGTDDDEMDLKSRSKKKRVTSQSPKREKSTAKKKRKKRDGESDEDVKKRSRSKKRKKSLDGSKSRRTLKGKSKSKDREKSKTRSKERSKTKRKSKERDRSKEKIKDRSKSRKGRSKTKQCSRGRSKIKTTGKSRSRTRGKMRSATTSKSRSKTREKSKRSPEKLTTKKGDGDKLKSSDKIDKVEHDEKITRKTPFSEHVERLKQSKLDRPCLSEKYKHLSSDLSALLYILNMNKMLLPCCILIDGQLYYKFGKGNAYCGLTYSNV